jgi:ATP-dependent DNA helicase PIF1
VVEFTAIDSGDVRKMQSCIAPHTIQLKLYAQVMLLKNIDIDLVNGSIGVVVGFVGKGKYAKKKAVERLRTPYRQKDSVMLDGEGEINMSIPFPVVKFSGGRIVVLERESWSVELPGGRESAKRDQIPLMLAWAISIHKSQGQTLDRVKVDLGKVFEKGQAYVALSRATSLDTLQILNFDPVRVMAHPTVTRFYRTLQTV